VSRLLLGRQLRRLRERKGLRAERVAAEVGVARATLWRMETGGSRCRYKPGDVEMLGRLYGADRDTIQGLVGLIKTTRARSWVAAYRDVLPDTVATCIDLESYACRIRHYAAGMMPDLLQHEGYARVLCRASHRMGNVRKYTQIRIHRQAILTRQPVTATFEFILDEAVLRRAGDRAVRGELG
jgi:transcriptional regulator with XRE-family HTH domain